MIWTVELLVHFFFLVDFEIDVFDSLTVLPFSFGMTWKDSFVFESKITFIVTRTLCTGIEMSHQNLCEHDHPLSSRNPLTPGGLHSAARRHSNLVYVGLCFPSVSELCCEVRLCEFGEKRENLFARKYHNNFKWNENISTFCNVEENESILHKISFF